MFHRITLLMITLLLTSVTLTLAETSAPKLPRTGQTTSYSAGDDGALHMGMPSPNPRFTDNGNGTITDKQTGLIWLKNANCFLTQNWATAVASAKSLASGACGLSDGSTAGQWRLPNIVELESLVNEQQASSAGWLNDLGFSGVQGGNYWSSSTYATQTAGAWYVGMDSGNLTGDNGLVGSYNKGDKHCVWPVRSGQ